MAGSTCASSGPRSPTASTCSAPPATSEAAASALREAIGTIRPRPDLIAFEAVPAGSAWRRLLASGAGGRAQLAPYRNSALPAPAVTLPESGGFEGWMASRSSNFRSQMRRMRRRLEARDGRVRMLREPGEVGAGLEAMLELHRLRWSGRGESGLARPGVTELLAGAAAELGPERLRLWVAEVQGEPISVQLFLAAGGEVKYWNGGWSEEHADLKPSMLTILAAIEDAIGRGERRLDLGVGTHEYKLRFADTEDTLTWGGLIVRNRRWPATRAELAPLVLRYRAKQLVRALPEPLAGRVEALAGGGGGGMIDMHSHLLPGIDDGPPSVQGSLELLRAASAAGITTLMATPHVSSRYRNDAATIAAAWAALEEARGGEEYGVEVRLGAEVAVTRIAELDPDELPGLCLGGGPWLLVEPPFTDVIAGLDVTIGELHRLGHRVLLAHPERCRAFHRNPATLESLVDGGVLTSLTSGSLVGRFGSQARRLALALLDAGLAHNVASDAHDAVQRPPSIAAELSEAGWDGARGLVDPRGPGGDPGRWRDPAAPGDGFPVPSPPPRALAGAAPLAHASLVIAMIIPIRTKMTIATCIQIHVDGIPGQA